MRKSTLLLFIATGWYGSIHAQPTLTVSGIMPVIGSTYITNGSPFVSPGSAGANQTWNLALSSSGPSSNTGVSPSSSPYASSFLGSTVAFNSGATWSFYTGTASAWQISGFVTGAGTVLAYSNPEDMLHFPFTYTNTYMDPWSTTYIQAGYTYYRWGTTTVTADAYGTLTTPDGTFSNVTRVHFYQDYKDSVNIMSNPMVITYINDEYMWYLNGNHSAIAAVYTFTPSSSSPITGGFYMSGVVSDVNEFSALVSLSLAPNPANDLVNFNVNLNEAKEVSVALYNSIGQKMEMPYNTTGIIGENKISISVADLPSGIYFATIALDGTEVSSQKFVVTH